MSDSEHTAASLGHSEELSVKHSVGEPIPEFPQPPEEGTKVPSAIARQYAGDVFPHQPAGAVAFSQGKINEGEIAARVIQPLSESCDGK